MRLLTGKLQLLGSWFADVVSKSQLKAAGSRVLRALQGKKHTTHDTAFWNLATREDVITSIEMSFKISF
jgi:hypothetical protein